MVIRQSWEAWPHAGNVMATYWGLYGRAEAALYRGEGRQTLDLIGRETATLNRATWYQFVVLLNLLMVQLHARTALAAAAAESGGRSVFSPRARSLRTTARDVRRIERRRQPWTNGLAKLLRAGIANLGGRPDEALSLLDSAERELLAVDMELYAAACRRQRGNLMGGEDGKTLRTSADTFMASQDIRNPARIAAVLAPGFPE